jgi:hypothetical protein
VDFAIALSAARFAMGSGQQSDQQNSGLSAQLMQSGWGKTLLFAVALGLVGVGGYHVYKGVSKKFLKDLRVWGGSGITAVGVSGYVAKGLVLAGAGILVIVATLQAEPSQAAGFDPAVKTLGQAPFGKFLLILAALGIAAFGAFSFVRARVGRMSARESRGRWTNQPPVPYNRATSGLSSQPEYVGRDGHPSGESSHSSWRPQGRMSFNANV